MATADLQARASAGDVRAQVLWAAELDGLGRHLEALEWLARAAKADDADALTALGLKLVLGENAPSRPKDGLGLLIDAAGRGGGRAASVVSVLAGAGFYAPQNWPVALDYLQRAAELGFEPAQAQLQALAGETAGHDWTALRGKIDLAAWTRASRVRQLSDSPRILALEGLVPEAVCDCVMASSVARLVRAEVHDPRTGRTIMGQTRTNRVANFGLADTGLLNILIQAKIGATAGAPIAMMEAFAVLNYAPGEEASEHYDYLDPGVAAYAEEIAQLGQRVATALVYLNDDYEGGETVFPELGLSHRGRKGDALIFFSVEASGAPDPRTVHAGRPPTRGEKWVLSQFIRNKPLLGRG